MQRVCDRIGELAGPAEPPARLHGDLWSGNVMAGADGGAWLVDPVAYGGHREVDLAMLRLFGAPSPRVLAAYAEAAPLAEGHEQRVELLAALPPDGPRRALRRRLRRLGRGRRPPLRRVGLRGMDLQIEGRTAVVTGASRGIGEATAALLEAEGARVVGVSRGAGIDVTDPGAPERIAELAGGPVDILVNNAGTSYAKPLGELTDEDWNAPVGAARARLDAAHARASRRAWPSAAGAGSSTSPPRRASARR